MATEIKHVEKEFIFSSLKEKQTPVELHVGTSRISALLKEFNDRELVFTVPPDADPVRERQEAVAFFRFRGHPMTFRTLVAERDGETLRLRQPKLLHRDLGRSFERILSPEGISVSLIVKGHEVSLNFPASDLFEPVEAPQYDLGFDVTRISNLLTAFRERAERIAGENRIVMFRERTPQTIQERLVATTGRILVVPPWTGDFQALDISIRERLLLKRHIEAMDNGEALLEEYELVSNQLRRKRIGSEVYCPILYRQYVVGYLYIMSTGESAGDFTGPDLEFLRGFARIFSYSLEVNGYFRAAIEEQELSDTQLIDISGSGLLFGLGVRGPDLSLYSEIDLRIHLGDVVLPARGRIMRRYSDPDRNYYGVHYSDMELQHMEKLFDELYGTDYRGDIDSRGLTFSDDGVDVPDVP